MKPDIHAMIRVNHAGEYGATRIYAGQLAVLKNRGITPLIQHMADQEKKHFEAFDALMRENRVRPTLLSPLWHIAGFALGAGSALLGKRAAMACTVAVESVIDEHYQDQLDQLEDNTPLKTLIETCHQEELEHRHTSLENDAEKMKGYKPFTTAVKAASKLAIFLSKRI
jgi:ubiquinone biosynthesis monooxygenase Coq7